ncbi:MAG TPA: D-alanyl-D-alanine carboxypeptidase [Hyphomicrobiales bacterium]|nr:D-alanyl-D-alanine carboxypeptidase [Hyphomicrobiales bacterium]
MSSCVGSRRAWSRAPAIVAGVALAAVALAGPAAARSHHHHRHHIILHRAAYSPPQSSIVVDAVTGRVLEAKDADALRYPASLTKVMTLYLLFDALERRDVKLDTEMTVSALAAAQAPTKLGLRAGETITVQDAILGIVTRSANDAAMVIAENIGGSEGAFVQRMNEAARALGMSRTVFDNPNGLPDERQHTTARDIATLGRAIISRFPREYHFFSTRSFVFRGHVIPSHNRLVLGMPGVDGLKTGFIRASGFNLLTSAHDGDRRIVAAVFGGRSAGARDAEMRGLVTAYLPKASRGGAMPALVAAATPARRAPVGAPQALVPIPVAAPDAIAEAAPQPVVRRVRTAVVEAAAVPLPTPAPAAVAATPAPQLAATPAVRRNTLTPSAIAARVDRATAMVGTTPGSPAMRWVVGAQPAAYHDDGTARAFAATASVSAPAEGRSAAVAQPAQPQGWQIQVGAADSVALAEKLIARAQPTVARVAGSAQSFTQPVQSSGGTLYRARFGGFDDRETAQLACAALKKTAMACFTARN